MPSRVVTQTTTTYLQVPKVLPYRRSRSRPRSRPGEVEYTELHSPKARPPTPVPSPSLLAASYERRLSNGASKTAKSDYSTSRAESPSKSVVERPNIMSMSSAQQCVSEHLPSTTTSASNGYHFHSDPSSGDLNGDLYTLAPSPSPPPEVQLPLRQRLVGTWHLESYVAHPTATCRIQRPTYPMTKNVTGLIMYTPDGYMSAHMLIPGQASFKRGEGDEAQWAEAGKRSFCYAGPYYISNEGYARPEILRHTFQVCNLPGWLKDVQVRTWRFEEDDDVLVLGSEAPTEIKGDQRIPVLKWRRARDNSFGSPPPPTPQIKVSGPGEP